MSEILDLFDDIQPEVDGMQLIDIDLDNINESAKEDAVSLIDNLSNWYYDEDFLQKNPAFKKRVDSDLESLRILFKMRKADEETHDILIKAIAGNSGNASLYRSLSEMQKTIISITTKINDIIAGLNNLMKGYQMELTFDTTQDISTELQDETPQSINQAQTTYRGSKEFIQCMNSIDLAHEKYGMFEEPQEIFEENEKEAE